MNASERKMVEILIDLRENHHVQGVKTEFEAEGARIEDVIRQKEITMLAGLPIALKIGGAEALTDLSLAKMVGVGKIIAPMMESPFAISKFIESVHKVYTKDELFDVNLAVNIESISAYNCYKEILATECFRELYGIAIGRNDLTLSMNLNREDTDSPQVQAICRTIMEMTKEAHPNVCCFVGGINSGKESMDVLRAYGSLLYAYETKKIIFSAQELEENSLSGLRKALEFEILYYSNRKAYYNSIATSEDKYLERIQKRYDALK